MTQKRWFPAAVLLLLFTVLVSGCGKAQPKADVSIFMMARDGIPVDAAFKLENSLKALVGDKPSIYLNTSPLFSNEKMIVEMGYGNHGILIIPEEQFKVYAAEGAFLPLDEHFKQEDYPEGVLEATIEPAGKKKNPPEAPKKETHLYGIPLQYSKWMKDNGVEGKGLVAFMAVNSRNPEQSFEVLKKIAAKS
ncbi:hypothetical protein ACFVVQ_16155 [Paenibacillus chitinolyticus]|uniref:hypothetical protein n=1 Tax=Paenibacillus chitinolyticus TaxID=79263 RepID=UPI0036DED43A